MRTVEHLVFVGLAVMLIVAAVGMMRLGETPGLLIRRRTQPVWFALLLAGNLLIAVALLYFHLLPLLGFGSR